MEAITKSGFYYPNKFALITINALEDVMGKNGLNAILNLASLGNLIDNLPEDNLNKEFDFADFSAINQALEEMYGPRGGRGLAVRTSRGAGPCVACWARDFFRWASQLWRSSWCR